MLQRYLPLIAMGALLAGAAIAAEAPYSLHNVIGSRGRGDAQLMNPTGIAVAADGSLWISDTGNGRILVLSGAGTLLKQIGGRDEFRPARQVQGAAGSNPIPANATSADRGDRRQMARDMLQSGPGRPECIALARDGSVYVADSLTNRVRHLAADGRLLAQWGGPGEAPGFFKRPAAIAVAADGNVFVADEENNRIQKFTAGGQLMRYWGGYGKEDKAFDGPWGLALDKAGDLWVCDWGNDRVQVFSGMGEWKRTIGGGAGEGAIKRPSGVAIDDSGHVWVASAGSGTVQCFDARGQFLFAVTPEQTGPSLVEGNYLAALAAGPDGKVYAADSLRSHILVFEQGPAGGAGARLVAQPRQFDGQRLRRTDRQAPGAAASRVDPVRPPAGPGKSEATMEPMRDE